MSVYILLYCRDFQYRGEGVHRAECYTIGMVPTMSLMAQHIMSSCTIQNTAAQRHVTFVIPLYSYIDIRFSL